MSRADRICIRNNGGQGMYPESFNSSEPDNSDDKAIDFEEIFKKRMNNFKGIGNYVRQTMKPVKIFQRKV